jgi:hypothetical protein
MIRMRARGAMQIAATEFSEIEIGCARSDRGLLL